MASASLKPCTHQGCPTLHRNRRGRCDEHAIQYNRERNAWIDANRPSAARRGYDKRWQAARKAHLEWNPLCAECGAEAREVHHINALADHPDLKYAPSNLVGLCKSCHARHTATERGIARKGAPGA